MHAVKSTAKTLCSEVRFCFFLDSFRRYR